MDAAEGAGDALTREIFPARVNFWGVDIVEEGAGKAELEPGGAGEAEVTEGAGMVVRAKLTASAVDFTRFYKFYIIK